MQRNWIGKSKGVDIQFDLDSDIAGIDTLAVYTTRPDTLMGVTYVSIAAEHPIAEYLAKDNETIAQFAAECKKQSVSEADMSSVEKRGIDTGLVAKHPITGDAVAIWIANYVLMDYGSGAVMAVPAHDERDYEFAQQYQLPITQVIAPADGSDCQLSESAYTDKGVCINSGEFDGLDFNSAFDAIAEKLTSLGKGKVTTNFRLRDWGVSRQRYWGTPIPMFNLPEGGEIPVPADRLPVLLPEDVEMDGVQSPIKADPNWRKATLDGKAVEHETDTFDTFMESSWYYARYTCADLENAMLDPAKADYWLPVDQYVGGIEHAILHLLYARFFHKLMRDEGLVSCDEPFERLLCQGMVLAETYYRKNSDGSTEWFNPNDVTLEKDDKGKPISATLTATGETVEIGGTTKMSKSKNNGVDPQTAVSAYGADTVRLFTMFAAPPTQTLEWSDSGVEGASRFLRRLWKTVHGHIHAGTPSELDTNNLSKEQQDLRRKTHETIAKVSDDYSVRQQFNTAIAAVMELMNEVSRLADRSTPENLAVEREAIEAAVLLLAPVAPHIAHSLWSALGHDNNIIDTSWPMVDQAALVKASITVVIQVNGKVRSKLEVPNGIEKAEMEALALADENVKKFTDGNTVRKVIVIPNKLVNIVAN